MSNRIDSLSLNCPKCNDPHKYTLGINRSVVMYNLAKRPEAKKHKFTRIFICPKTNEKFQARFVVTEKFGEIIHDVVSIKHQEEETKNEE